MTVKEWHVFRATTESADFAFGLPGQTRAILYETSLQTGLRATELYQLTPAKLTLDNAKPYVIAKATSTKNEKIARQYITKNLADRLSQLTAAPQPTVFEGMPTSDETAGMLRHNLSKAREAAIKEDPKRSQSDFLTEKNSAGERYDFHLLRHTCGAWLAMASVHPKAIQQVTRHSTISLTMDTYGHLFPSMNHLAIESLGEILDS